jgi:PAS domain S-box-containing protein
MNYPDLILNLTLLVALSIGSGYIEKIWPRSTRAGVSLQGLLFGGTTVLGMLRPVILMPGLIFDGRSVMLSLCALFFGPWAAMVAGLIAAVWRVGMGGVGAGPGVLVIATATGIGLLAHYRFKSSGKLPSTLNLYRFGITVHLAMLGMLLSLPDGRGLEVVRDIAFPVMLFYPLATILAGKLLVDQVEAGRVSKQLRDSEESFRQQFQNHTAVKLILDPDNGDIIDANQAAVDFYGWSHEQLTRMKIQEINTLPPEQIRQAMEKAQALNRVHFEFRHRRADGTIRDVEVFSNVIDMKGKRRLHSIVHDITERKQTERALQESETKYRRLFETMAQGVVYHAADGAIIEVNPAAERILGLTQDHLLGKTSMDPRWKSIREDGSEVAGKDHPAMVALRTGLKVQSFIIGVFHPETNLYSWLSVSATPIFEPGSTTPSGAYATFEDITELRKIEHEYKMLFREMLNGFALHEIICDEKDEPVDYRFLAVNPAFESMTGLKAKDILGKTLRQALPGAESRWIKTYGQVALTGQPTQFEDYSEALGKHFEVTAFRPAPNQFACIFSDVTARKRAESEREKLQSQLVQAQKMESVGRLAGGVAHDFNNMLSVILGNTEIALAQVDHSHPLYEPLQDIHTATVRSTNLTKQLLAFARKQTIAPKVINLNDATESSLKMLRRLIGENIDLAWLPESGLWPVKIDTSQLEQILTNLCVNARDAITDVGKVSIKTENRSLDKAYCSAHPGFTPGDYVVMSISDDGCGMDKETLDNLFEPFFTTKELGEGTGLGLATVYGIVRQNDGAITVDSKPGAGTTFTIYLPRNSSKTEPPAQEHPETGPARGSETVLVVEDELGILKMTQRMLTQQGYTVLAASSPEEAIRMTSQYKHTIDLLLTDVVMPGMNGRALCERLTALQPEMKCLYMSGFTADVIAHRGILDAGVNFISKPFTSKDLAEKIRAALSVPEMS